ncbi:MAG: SCE4755 family polysaccharide monooxygenase-like protein [Myxococcota bacterium]
MLRLTAFALCWLAPAAVCAHIHMVVPEARHTAQKNGPCGQRDSTPGAVVATYESGQTITVMFDETINHPSHYRISLAETDGDLVDPTSLDDRYTNEFVVLDGLPDADGGRYEFEVTLPELTCERCTLQLVQVMYDKAPPLCERCVYGDNDLYYQCADIEIVAAGEAPEPDPDPEPEPEPMDPGEEDGAEDDHGDHDHEHEHGDDDGAAQDPSSPPSAEVSSDAVEAYDSQSVVGCAALTPSWGLVLLGLFCRRRRR